jgi:hypothetical protein
LGKTQIVAQWSDKADFDALIVIEDVLEGSSENIYEVDGHDIGSGKFNVFMYAKDRDVEAAVAHIVQVYKANGLAPGMKLGVAVYLDKKRTDWTFKPVYPPDLKSFELM